MIEVVDKSIRDEIEAFTLKNTFPHIIIFQEIGGKWVTSTEALTDVKLETAKVDFKDEVAVKGIITDAKTVTMFLKTYDSSSLKGEV